MNGNKRIDGKNAILIVEGNNITVIYKNAFGEISSKVSKRFDFTFDEVEDIEYKKPGITMNGFIFLVLKNEDMHKIVLNKLNEYSFEITDEFVKDMEYKIKGAPEEEVVAVKEEEKKEPIAFINDGPYAIFPQMNKKEEEEKDREKNKIVVTDKAVAVVNDNIKVVKPKSKEEIEKDKIREELRKKIEAKKNGIEEIEIDPFPVIAPQKKKPEEEQEEQKKKPIEIDKKIEKQPEEKQEDVVLVPDEYAIDNKKKELEEELSKQKEEEIETQKEQEALRIEEQKKKHDESKRFPNILKRINMIVKKDKTKTEEFDKEESKKILVGTVETNEKGEVKKVPIEVAVRPLKKEEIEELEKKKNDIIIDELKHKLYVIESELATLKYEMLLIEKYSDTTYDRKEIDKLLKQIEDLVKILEAIKKEIIAKMEGKDYVANKALDVTGDDIVNVDDFKTIYVKSIDKINEFEASLNTLKEKTEERKKEIDLTDKEYENDLKNLDEKQKLVKYYDDFIARTLTYSYQLSYVVGKKFEEQTNTYIRNIYELRNDTRMLMALSAVSMVTPGLNGPVSAVLATTAGISAMRDAIVPARQVTRQEVRRVPVDYSTEISRNLRNAYEASKYLTDARKDISEIKAEITDKYKNYPEYSDIIEDFEKLEVELDRQEKQLNYMLYLTKSQINLTNNQKTLVLERESENIN